MANAYNPYELSADTRRDVWIMIAWSLKWYGWQRKYRKKAWEFADMDDPPLTWPDEWDPAHEIRRRTADGKRV